MTKYQRQKNEIEFRELKLTGHRSLKYQNQGNKLKRFARLNK
jgi:hypothetical protein